MNTVVIGEAENTIFKTSTRWVIIVLHEHFHQLQYSQPKYKSDVAGLNITGMDAAGMWMLNFPFPYTSPEVRQQVSMVSKLLAQAIQASAKDIPAKLTAYFQARQQLQRMLTPDEYKYFSFQLWQEGIARYTEYRVAEWAAENYTTSKEFEVLPDYVPYKVVAASIHDNEIIGGLSQLDLASWQRVVFYTLGAGEALLLDKIGTHWQQRIFTEPFFIDKYFG